MAERVCPWWLGYLLASPIRRWFEKPEEVLGPHLKSGATALDVGCAMGFFSLPMAEIVGPSGRVLCVDLQERMIRSLRKRASRAGLSDRIETRVCSTSSLDIGDLIAEPRGHVSEEALEETVAIAEKAGLSVIDRPDIKRSRTVLLEKSRG